MKPILFAVIGMTIYAVTGVIIEQRLEKFSTAALVLLFTAPMVVISLIWLAVQKNNGGVAFPAGGALALTLILGAVYFFGDYFYLGAFTSGGNVLAISTIAILAPVLTAIIRHFWVGGWPNGYQIGGYALAAAAVLLMAKGASA